MTDTSKTTITAPVSGNMMTALRKIRAQAPRIVLVICHRDGAQAVPLEPKQRLVVGREAPSDVCVGDTSLSRRHARFERTSRAVRVDDLDSRNGVWINGERVETAELRAGDFALLGNVTVAVHQLSDLHSTLAGIRSHDQFESSLDREMVKARFFGRPLALVMFRRVEHDESSMVRAWPEVQSQLRPVDELGLFSPGIVEVLLPEMDLVSAQQWAQGVLESTAGALCGAIAMYPDSATHPPRLVEEARGALRQTSAAQPLVVAATHTTDDLGTTDSTVGIVTQSPAMQETLEMVERVATATIPILLQGETGSGKEVLARAIHKKSTRRDGPLISVNCGAIPSQLIEATLFGHERGAFTGAHQQHRGVFEAAQGGTVLLDEVGELPMPAQAALLRVLDSKRIVRVGSTKEVEVDVRVVAATNRDLDAMCERGEFRLDLLYRLNAMTLELPPLRKRKEDIPELAKLFLAEANQQNQRSVRSIDEAGMAALQSYGWPGNVRELRNAIDRAVVIARADTITMHELPTRVRGASETSTWVDLGDPPPSAPIRPEPAEEDGSAADFRDAVQRFEIRLITEALHGRSQADAAKQLGLPLRTLAHKMKTLGIKRRGYSCTDGDDLQ